MWPSGLWGALDETPYSLDVDAARALLAEAGHADGFGIRLGGFASALAFVVALVREHRGSRRKAPVDER